MTRVANSEILRQANEATYRAVAQLPRSEIYLSSGILENKSYKRHEAIGLMRAEADRKAIWQRFHDEKIYETGAPDDTLALACYRALEEARVEAVANIPLPGTAKNIDYFLYDETRRRDLSHSEAGDVLAMPLVLRRWARAEFLGMKLDVPEAWHGWMQNHLSHYAEKLSAQIQNQKTYAEITQALLADLGFKKQMDEADSHDDPFSQIPPDVPKMENDDDSTGAQIQSADELIEDNGEETAPADLGQMMEAGFNPGGAGAQEKSGKRHARPEWIHALESPSDYKVYTREFDEIVPAEKLASTDEMRQLRQQLDEALPPLGPIITRLANRLQRQLMAQQQRHWVFDQDEGILDNARLARVIVNPTHGLQFKQEVKGDFRDTVVSLLLDNSGSMRGRPILMAALAGEIITRTLERCSVKTEILGFTTATWKGGRARDAWHRDQQPATPGRLNELRHIIYKSADTPFRRVRNALGVMLKEGLLKENVDGEALTWAAQRLAKRPEARKILLVISDGAPVDDATLAAAPAMYLERHLQQVINTIETSGKIELRAIGIGHDVRRYYSQAITIQDVAALGQTLVGQLGELFHK
ncbi:MAG TPA: cobaltochelatase subunit CobT [Alphaproteobacteria bacterium]|nr:cobaltochelatase subunit CobT [Alphaproteobacteria bacterium]